MGLKFNRKKERHLLLTILYRTHKLLPFSPKFKFKLYLNLSWIFHRLAHETSFLYYQEDSHPIRNFEQDFLIENIQPSDHILDLGCKYGYISKNIAKKAALVVGVDYDQAAIDKANQLHKLKNLKFYNQEASEFLRQANEKFNVLILSHVLEHLDNPKDFLKRFSPLFERIYIEVPDFQSSLLNEYRADLNLKLSYLDADHIHEFDRKELKDLIESVGMEIEDSMYIYGLQKVWCKAKI